VFTGLGRLSVPELVVEAFAGIGNLSLPEFVVGAFTGPCVWSFMNMQGGRASSSFPVAAPAAFISRGNADVSA
jgi:hypothetical protein